jgi:hypothetical protein
MTTLGQSTPSVVPLVVEGEVVAVPLVVEVVAESVSDVVEPELPLMEPEVPGPLVDGLPELSSTPPLEESAPWEPAAPDVLPVSSPIAPSSPLPPIAGSVGVEQAAKLHAKKLTISEWTGRIADLECPRYYRWPKYQRLEKRAIARISLPS